MHWLCRLGIHHWDFHCEVAYGFVTDTAWCTRPGCRYEEPMIVNREESRIPPPQQGDPLRPAA